MRNHWASNFNDQFLFVADTKWQGYGVKVWRIGILNFALCLIVNLD
jgi:hypothetical protein